MKIGIVTLHRLTNCGSALQAYALQKYIENLTNDRVEIIDYIYPNKFHLPKATLMERLKNAAKTIGLGRYVKRTRRYYYFYRKFFNLTPHSYDSIEAIQTNPPIYDLYITGSDQVWNVNSSIKDDPTMYCCFAPVQSRKIAFGASFSIKSLPKEFHSEIQNRLNRYSHIGIREASSFSILQNLELNKDIETMVTGDPVLLLDAKDYHEIALHSTLQVKEDYILVYFLDYAYNPEPAMTSVIENIVRYLNIQVVHIGSPGFIYHGQYRSIKNIGPCEFVYLFENAKFVITSSFHGTMFSIINRKKFVSILPDNNCNDCRIENALSTLGLSQQGICRNEANPIVPLDEPYTPEFEINLASFINSSKSFLQRAIFNK